MKNKYFPAVRTQLSNHCGPTAMGLCLSVILGKQVSPREVCAAAKNRIKVWFSGLNETELQKASKVYGVTSKLVLYDNRRMGRRFMREIRDHVVSKGPVIVLIDDFSHWVTVLGYQGGKFLIRDSLEKKIFERWTPKTFLYWAWNLNEPGDKEPSQFFGIFPSRDDGLPPAVKTNTSFVRKCRKAK
jgi:ABC-type bacteriocin/lantibiotic exporter with double-glycine peptidase domain